MNPFYDSTTLIYYGNKLVLRLNISGGSGGPIGIGNLAAYFNYSD